jgi:hypothetical protein
MTNTPDHPVSDQHSPQPVRPWRPIVITLLSALLLGAGSCFGYLSTMSGGSTVSGMFMVTFLLCLIIFIGSLVWAFVTLIRNAKRGG